MIITANRFFSLADVPQLRYHNWEEWVTKFVLRHMLRHGVQAQGISDAPPLQAIVRQGKWIVLCENPKCTGAEKVWEEGYMMCCSCLNGHARHQFLKTIFPPERQAIEAILEPRVMDARNWEPPETPEILRAQNIEAGDPVEVA